MLPVYRVNWLRAKARRDRWAEELELTRSEMTWTGLFYQHCRKVWEARAEKERSENSKLGFYALKQAKNWGLLESHVSNTESSMM